LWAASLTVVSLPTATFLRMRSFARKAIVVSSF
jgi:hypothetical protein